MTPWTVTRCMHMARRYAYSDGSSSYIRWTTGHCRSSLSMHSRWTSSASSSHWSHANLAGSTFAAREIPVVAGRRVLYGDCRPPMLTCAFSSASASLRPRNGIPFQLQQSNITSSRRSMSLLSSMSNMWKKIMNPSDDKNPVSWHCNSGTWV
eukprot:scaffold6721_cov51-Attheya_sp.AAC.3